MCGYVCMHDGSFASMSLENGVLVAGVCMCVHVRVCIYTCMYA